MTHKANNLGSGVNPYINSVDNYLKNVGFKTQILKISTVVFAIILIVAALAFLGHFVPALSSFTSTMTFMSPWVISGPLCGVSFTLFIVGLSATVYKTKTAEAQLRREINQASAIQVVEENGTSAPAPQLKSDLTEPSDSTASSELKDPLESEKLRKYEEELTQVREELAKVKLAEGSLNSRVEELTLELNDAHSAPKDTSELVNSEIVKLTEQLKKYELADEKLYSQLQDFEKKLALSQGNLKIETEKLSQIASLKEQLYLSLTSVSEHAKSVLIEGLTSDQIKDSQTKLQTNIDKCLEILQKLQNMITGVPTDSSGDASVIEDIGPPPPPPPAPDSKEATKKPPYRISEPNPNPLKLGSSSISSGEGFRMTPDALLNIKLKPVSLNKKPPIANNTPSVADILKRKSLSMSGLTRSEVDEQMKVNPH